MRRSQRHKQAKTSQSPSSPDSKMTIPRSKKNIVIGGAKKQNPTRQILQPIETVDVERPAVEYMKTRRAVSAVKKADRFIVGADENNKKRSATSSIIQIRDRPKKLRKLEANANEQSLSVSNTEFDRRETDHSFEEGRADMNNDSKKNMQEISNVNEQSPSIAKNEFERQELEHSNSFEENEGEMVKNSKENMLEMYSRCDVKPVVKDEFDENEELLNYQRIRDLNIKANEDFFASLGLDEAKEALQTSVKKKIQPSQRGLKIHREPQVPLPRRCSLRIRHKDPVGKSLPEPDPIFEEERQSRLPPGPVPMISCVYSKSDDSVTDDCVSVVSTLICRTKAEKMHAPVSRKVFQAALEKVTITERRVAKVVPGRVFSLTWHPSSQSLISIAGDKYGHIGFWDVNSSNVENQDIVKVFKPHISPVSDIFIPPADPHKLYSSSYDATLRCCDFEREVFDEVFSVSSENDDLFRNFSFIDATSTMLVSHFSGKVSLVDTRTPSTSAEQVYQVSKKSLRTVSVHPTCPHYFISAGIDAKILLWDLRAISSISPKPVQKLEHHTKAVSSAYFSPSGHKVLSSSADDTILIYSVDAGCKLDLIQRMRHNNFTGRWLTKFQPNWHPTVEDVFVSGSMLRPRQIEVFSADGVLLKALTNENFLGSVCSLNAFHPSETCTLVGANSSGRLHVFM